MSITTERKQQLIKEYAITEMIPVQVQCNVLS